MQELPSEKWTASLQWTPSNTKEDNVPLYKAGLKYPEVKGQGNFMYTVYCIMPQEC